MNELYIPFPLSNKCEAITTTTALGNLAYQVDNGNFVMERRILLAKSLNIEPKQFVFVHQSHSDVIKKVTIEDLGKGQQSFEEGMECDALYTYEKNVPLGIFHADCVPIFFIVEKKNLVGIIHAGFKGTMKHVTYKVIKEVMAKENVKSQDFKFYIGPYRQLESFEVDENSQKQIQEAGLESAILNGYFDNGLANKIDLYDLGIKEEQIESCGFNTFNDERFYSAYKKEPVGRLVSLIYLK